MQIAIREPLYCHMWSPFCNLFSGTLLNEPLVALNSLSTSQSQSTSQGGWLVHQKGSAEPYRREHPVDAFTVPVRGRAGGYATPGWATSLLLDLPEADAAARYQGLGLDFSRHFLGCAMSPRPPPSYPQGGHRHHAIPMLHLVEPPVLS